MHKNTQDKGVAIVYFRCIYWYDSLHRTTLLNTGMETVHVFTIIFIDRRGGNMKERK